MEFVPVDIVFALIILLAMIRGAIRGFVTEFLSMASIILGVAAAVLFSKPLASAFQGFLGESMWVRVIAFLGLFVAGYLAVKLVEGLLHKGIEKLNLNKLDRVLGLLLGLLEGVLVVSVAIFLFYVQPFFDVSGLLDGSYFVKLILPFLVPAAEWLRNIGVENA